VRPSSRRRRSAAGRRSGRVRPSESGAQDRLSYSLPGNDLRFAPSSARFRSRAIRAGRAWPPAAAHGEPPRTAGSTAATSTEPFRDGRPAVLRFRLTRASAPSASCAAALADKQRLGPVDRAVAADEEQLRSLRELLDDCECALGPDCLPAGASFSSEAGTSAHARFRGGTRICKPVRRSDASAPVPWSDRVIAAASTMPEIVGCGSERRFVEPPRYVKAEVTPPLILRRERGSPLA
jgi:hypothetical protein